MSKRNPGSNSFVKQIEKASANNLKQSSMTDEELIKTLKILPRDEESYPMPDKKDIERAGSFIYKLSLLASSADMNLQALIWEMYIHMDDFLHLDKENAAMNLASTLEALKEYLKESDNILFKEIPEKTNKEISADTEK